ncbi:MAG TPA: hypothetical protein VGQ48_09505 [Gemmatimonadales bacterium]|jgi:hypothetical protein|nr:hypothetical protein [Gemmatimonadales bacterium]
MELLLLIPIVAITAFVTAKVIRRRGAPRRGDGVEESERIFREQAFQDPGNARQQAARGTFDPGYLNYTLDTRPCSRTRPGTQSFPPVNTSAAPSGDHAG